MKGFPVFLIQISSFPILESNLLLYVIDSAETSLISCSTECGLCNSCVLQDLFSNPSIKQLPLLILANKQDLPGALSASKLSETFSSMSLSTAFVFVISILDSIPCFYSSDCIGTSATTGQGISDVLEAISQHNIYPSPYLGEDASSSAPEHPQNPDNAQHEETRAEENRTQESSNPPNHSDNSYAEANRTEATRSENSSTAINHSEGTNAEDSHIEDTQDLQIETQHG